MNSVGNKHIVLIMGKPNCGKSTSLMNLANQERIAYLNTDCKQISFKSNMIERYITNPNDVLSGISDIEQHPDIDMAVLDTLSFLMDQYEQQYVLTSTNTQKAWQDYAKFYKSFIHAIKSGTKDYVILAHSKDVLNEAEMTLETKIPIKGSVGHTGAEADFSTILSAKKISIKEADKHLNDLLTISDDEREDGVKYVFQTRIDKDSIGEKIRSQIGLWNRNEKYINNDISLVFKRLHEYYA